jgi:hypothetical protein
MLPSHIYWMTFKEYYKWSKSQDRLKKNTNGSGSVRTHIFFK